MKNVRAAIIVFVIAVIVIAADTLPAEEGFTLLATMSGDSVGDEFCIVAGVGDINCDGYPDVLVGAPGGEYAKLYFGGAPFDTIPDLIFRDEKEYTRFGCSVAGGGDVNGDGYPDIVIGASGTWIGPSWPYHIIAGAGAAYVYFGGPDMDTIPDLELVVGNWDEQVGWYYHFGNSVSIVGDINNDGYDDIAIGAPNDDYDAHGRVYIYFGGPDIDSQYDVLLEGEDHFDNFGWAISGAGDVNRDGFDDVLIGAPQVLSDNPGKAYLIYGGDEIRLSNSEVFVGNDGPYSYGKWVSALRDVNRDSYEDFGIMSDEYFQVISGETLKPLCEISTNSEWAAFQSISGGGDINSDGYCDIFVGIQNKAAQYTGMMVIYLGSVNIDTIPTFEISGQTPYHYFASSIFYLGDINNDGHNEIIIGEHQKWGWDGPGKVYIYSYGKPDKIKEGSSLLKYFRLYQNYPNPFNANTYLSYNLSSACDVTIIIYNLQGQKIRTLVSAHQPSGYHSIIWDGKDDNDQNVASGIYLYQMLSTSSNFKQSPIRKMVLLK